MEEETKDRLKLPPFLTTITPFSKFLALALFITLPFLGFYLGIKYGRMTALPPASVKTVPVVVQKIPTPTPTPAVCNTNLCVENGAVYYTNAKSQRLLIAKSVSDPSNPVANTQYKFAQLSPNQKFITLGGVRWETVIFQVYEISTGNTHTVNATGSDFGYWLKDNRLLVLGGCGMGIDCGIYLSKDSQQPWIMEQVADAPAEWSK